jgi:2-keto-4-pentenoate hydratase
LAAGAERVKNTRVEEGIWEIVMEATEMERVIDEFDAARQRGEYFPKAWYSKLSLDEAYRIQLALIARRCAREGQRRVGWKVGLTAPVIQEQFGFKEPVFGCLLEKGMIRTGHVFRHADIMGPGFENELCIRLARDVAPGASLAEITNAVGVIHPALEIVETRGDFVSQIALAMADNAQQHSFVIGAPVLHVDPSILPQIVATVRVNGDEVGSGKGEAVLGHPLNSIAWLAGKLSEFGEKLSAGDFIMTGSFTRQFPLKAGDKVETTFEGLGKVTAEFA